MKSRDIVTKLGLTSVLAAVIFFTSCTPQITEEQLAKMKELREKERSLNEMISKRKKEKSKLEAELRARQNELKKCNDDKDFVKQKLSEWPNCWPDWKPESEEPETTEEGEK
jgi:septal ring factor EnvC (AmiA/AmiB activator)